MRRELLSDLSILKRQVSERGRMEGYSSILMTRLACEALVGRQYNVRVVPTTAVVVNSTYADWMLELVNNPDTATVVDPPHDAIIVKIGSRGQYPRHLVLAIEEGGAFYVVDFDLALEAGQERGRALNFICCLDISQGFAEGREKVGGRIEDGMMVIYTPFPHDRGYMREWDELEQDLLFQRTRQEMLQHLTW